MYKIEMPLYKIESMRIQYAEKSFLRNHHYVAVLLLSIKITSKGVSQGTTFSREQAVSKSRDHHCKAQRIIPSQPWKQSQAGAVRKSIIQQHLIHSITTDKMSVITHASIISLTFLFSNTYAYTGEAF